MGDTSTVNKVKVSANDADEQVTITLKDGAILIDYTDCADLILALKEIGF